MKKVIDTEITLTTKTVIKNLPISFRTGMNIFSFIEIIKRTRNREIDKQLLLLRQ